MKFLMHKRGFTVRIFVSAIVILVTACNTPSEPPVVDEPTVSGATVRFGPNSPTIQNLRTERVAPVAASELTFPGRIVWDEDHTSRLMPTVSGRLIDIVVQAGQSVNKGQELAHFSSPDLGSAQTDAARAQTDLVQAERNLSRTKELVEAGVVARKDLDTAQADVARARVEAERASLRLQTLGASSAVDQHFTLRSPISGVVVERNTNPGMEWRSDQPAAQVFVISDPTYMWAWIDVPESVLGTLRPGMTLDIHSSAWPQEHYAGRIDYVGDALDPTSRTLKVRASLRNPQRHLKAEMYVTATSTVHATDSQDMLSVPSSAVFLSDGAQHVFVKTAEGQYSRVTIAPINPSGKSITLKHGLNLGDEVVVDGALYLQQLLERHSSTPASGNDARAAL